MIDSNKHQIFAFYVFNNITFIIQNIYCLCMICILSEHLT